MRFLLDESAEFRIAALLREAGHDVTASARDYPQALADHEVLAIAQREGRILITNDSDFGELIFRQNLPHAGVILLRLGPGATAEDKTARLQHLLTTHQDHLEQFIVVTQSRVRVRLSAAPS
ncbi:MAG: DUF5615 family PIN-like protein [Chloroflexi bacterium]|nr:DUF5615 family PIN-like protein [Chloroflexota bacterium]